MSLNNNEILNSKYSTGLYTFNKQIHLQTNTNILTIQVTENTNSLLHIKKFFINNYDLINDHDLFNTKFKYVNNNTNKEENVSSSFWTNASLILSFTTPFTLWYQENTTKNVVISESMAFCATDQDLEYYQMAVDKVKKLIV